LAVVPHDDFDDDPAELAETLRSEVEASKYARVWVRGHERGGSGFVWGKFIEHSAQDVGMLLDAIHAVRAYRAARNQTKPPHKQ
jgi:hypothetical protein